MMTSKKKLVIEINALKKEQEMMKKVGIIGLSGAGVSAALTIVNTVTNIVTRKTVRANNEFVASQLTEMNQNILTVLNKDCKSEENSDDEESV